MSVSEKTVPARRSARSRQSSSSVSDGLPSNVDAERFVLGSILLDDTVYVQAASTLTPDDFSLEKHRRIFKRMADLAQRDETIDRMTVANELMKFGELEACDGLSYLVSLDDGLPQIPNLDSYVRIVKEKAVLRRIVVTSQHLMNRALQADEAPGEILSWGENALLGLRDSQAEARLQSAGKVLSDVMAMAADRAQRYLETGKPVMGISTGIRTLDQILNGLNPKLLYLLGGGPGSGKTTFALQISIEAILNGIHVIYVSYENSQENLVLKALCARSNVDPRRIERGVAHAEEYKRFQAAASELAGPLATNLDTLEARAGLQMAEIRAKILRARRESKSTECLVVFDFLQRAAPGQGYTDARNNVSLVAAKLRDLANELGAPVVALSSLNRASNYAKNGDQRRQLDLDALKESGDLEYTADVVMFLESSEKPVPHEESPRELSKVVVLRVKKQRFGPIDQSVDLVFRPDIGVFRELTNESFKATV